MDPKQDTPYLKILDVRRIEQLQYLKAFEIIYESKSGQVRRWELVSRDGAERLKNEIFNKQIYSDGAVIFATNPEKTHVVLLEEFRVGAGKALYMLPAGLNDTHEAPGDCAVREFKEETGLTLVPHYVDQPRYLSVGIVNERVFVVYGTYSGQVDLSLQSDQEAARVVFVDREEAQRILQSEEVTMRTALLLENFFQLNPYLNAE